MFLYVFIIYKYLGNVFRLFGIGVGIGYIRILLNYGI